MNVIPKSGEEARQMLADAERSLAELKNALSTAVVDHALAEGRKDGKASEKFNTVAQVALSKLPAARELVTYLRDMSERLTHAEGRLARDQRLARWKSIRPEAEKAGSRLNAEQAAVVKAAQTLLLASKSLADVRTETRELRNEYDALCAEFGNGDRIGWDGLDFWRIPLAPGLPLEEVLGGLRGRKRSERTNRAISPLKNIDSYVERLKRAK
jgi:hypothetical protein